ncbi:MAG: DUF5057 domain-containing protein [Lachnospiraceae bacterium]|nr:DUF5057 domain-containing protein [Lachnospiraceae bacterium]
MNKYKKKKKNFIKPKISKKLMAATGASVLAVSVAGAGLWQYLKPVPVEAKETFSGIKQVVAECNAENPFVILDIVPGNTDYTCYFGTAGSTTTNSSATVEVSLATLPYLTAGTTPAEQAVINAVKANPTAFYEASNRAALAENLIPASINTSMPNVKYEEGYGGITEGLTEAGGWTKVYDAATYDSSVTGGALYTTYPSGMLYGKVQEYVSGDTTGYDYQSAGRSAGSSSTYGANGIVYEAATGGNGEYHVTFKYAGKATEGYIVTFESADLSSCSETTGLYQKINGVYQYFFMKKDIPSTENSSENSETAGEGNNTESGMGNGNNETGNGNNETGNNETGNGNNEAGNGNNEAGNGNNEAGNGNNEAGNGNNEAGNGNNEAGNGNNETGNGNNEAGNGNNETGNGNNEAGNGNNETGNGNNETGNGNNEAGNGNNEAGNGNNEAGNGENGTASLSSKWYKCVGTGLGTTTGTEPQTGTGTSSSTEYYFLTFTYVSNLTEAIDVYEIENITPVSEIAVNETDSKPYDTYNRVSGNGTGETTTTEGEGENAGASRGSFALRPSSATTTNTYVYVGAGQGNYKLTQLSEDSTDPDAQVLNIVNAPVYIRCRNQNDWLKQYVFNSLDGEENASENFTIQVQTVEANKVTAEMIAQADLIYLEDGMTGFQGDGSDFHKHYITADDSGSLGTDMSKDAVFGIVYRAVNDLLPVMVDYGIVTNSTDYANTNYQKLAKIMLKRDLTSYYEEMESADNLLMNISSSDYPDKADNGYNYVNRNVYIMNDSPLAGEDFDEAFEESKMNAGFKEVMTAILAENSTLEEENKISELISKAKVIQYIINYAGGLVSDFKDMRILELQPTTNSISDLHVSSNEEKKNTTLYWKKTDSKNAGQQILRSSKVINITVDSKSVDEFAGEIADINDNYQMIFIGLDGQRLNYENKKTVYNDSSLNGKVYAATGDIADDSGNRYAGIDLTQEKKNALLDFMRAGYPIVVEDNFFKDKTAKEVGSEAINTKYIEENSQMYDFLKRAVSEYQDYIYTISDVHSSAMFPAQVNIRRPQISYQDSNTAQIQSVTADSEGKYKGTISYKITDDRGEAYSSEISIRLYFDLNDDGKYEDAEEVGLDGYSNENGTIVVDFDEANKGMVPWKLTVSDSGNMFRRDDLRGFFLFSDSKMTPVRILQIAQESADESANLEKTYEVSNTLLGYYLRGAEGLTGSTFEIKTITPQQLQSNLTKQKNYLEGFDILVLGFGPSYSLGDAADAVNHYIEENRPIVVSSTALSVENDCMGLSKALLGVSDTGTYARLGSAKGGQNYYRFNCLQGEMFGARQNLMIEQMNDGIISHYPYDIASNSSVIYQSIDAGDYLLDFAQNDTLNGQAAVTAWYSLGNSLVESDFNAYEVSRQDGANNYYVYSKGNLVYVGQDSYPFQYDSVAGNDPMKEDGAVECQIFVNALMSAYNAGIKNPKVSMVAGFALDAPEVESVCIPFDQQLFEDGDEEQGLLDETTDVYFKVSDVNLAFSKNVDISFYYKDDAAGEIDIGGETVHATAFASPIWMVGNGQLVEVGEQEELKPGVIYKIKAPVTALKDSSKTGAEIYVVARSAFHKYGKDQVVIGSDSVTINRAQLFLLE